MRVGTQSLLQLVSAQLAIFVKVDEIKPSSNSNVDDGAPDFLSRDAAVVIVVKDLQETHQLIR